MHVAANSSFTASQSRPINLLYIDHSQNILITYISTSKHTETVNNNLRHPAAYAEIKDRATTLSSGTPPPDRTPHKQVRARVPLGLVVVVSGVPVRGGGGQFVLDSSLSWCRTSQGKMVGRGQFKVSGGDDVASFRIH